MVAGLEERRFEGLKLFWRGGFFGPAKTESGADAQPQRRQLFPLPAPDTNVAFDINRITLLLRPYITYPPTAYLLNSNIRTRARLPSCRGQVRGPRSRMQDWIDADNRVLGFKKNVNRATTQVMMKTGT